MKQYQSLIAIKSGPVGRQKIRGQLSMERRAAYLTHGAKLPANFLSSYRTGLNRYQTLRKQCNSAMVMLFRTIVFEWPFASACFQPTNIGLTRDFLICPEAWFSEKCPLISIFFPSWHAFGDLFLEAVTYYLLLCCATFL